MQLLKIEQAHVNVLIDARNVKADDGERTNVCKLVVSNHFLVED